MKSDDATGPNDRSAVPDYSRVAKAYAVARPRYPEELFVFLSSLLDRRRLAWDCATGSGQAAVDLTEYFEWVIATDLSPTQIAQAPPRPRVSYRVASAEESGLEDSSADLVTVASGIHWFDLDRFFSEVRRVLRPGGVLAAWSYHVGHVEPPFDRIFHDFYRDVVSPYFAAGAQLVDDGYETLVLPGERIETPSFHVCASWSLADTLTFVESWSGTQQYVKLRGESPVPLIARHLEAMWGDRGRTRTLRWPLYLRVSRL
jgi:SAM-dependent methyltransferase